MPECMWHAKNRIGSKWDIRLEAGHSAKAPPRSVGQSLKDIDTIVRAQSAHARGAANNCRAARRTVPSSPATCLIEITALHAWSLLTAWQRRRHAPRDVSATRHVLTGANPGAGHKVQGAQMCAAAIACPTESRCQRHSTKRQCAPSRVACAPRRPPHNRGTNRRTCLRGSC